MTAFSPRGPDAPGKLDAGIDFRLLEAVIQNSNDSVVITAIEPGSDGRRRITWVNPAFSRITGYSAEEAIGQSASFLFNPDKSSPGFRNLLDATRSRQIGHAELELERKDGSHYWLELNVVPVTATDLESQPMVTISRDITERKRLEQAMREQEEFFRTLVENSRDMVSVLDLSGTVLFQSPASTQILGYTPAEMVGHNAAEYVHPDDKEQLYELAQAAHDPARASFSHEARFRHGDGRWLVLEVVGRTITDRSGQPVWILNSRDVTERRQAEDALRTSEQRFRDFAEVASDWFWEQDANLRFTYVSPGVTAVTGRAVSDIIGTTREELYRFDSADPVWAEHRRTIANHEPFENFRYSRVGPNGRLTHRQISGRPIFDDGGKFLGYRGVGRDVTAEVEAEQRATQAERHLRNALASLREGFTLYDENDVLVLQNRRRVML